MLSALPVRAQTVVNPTTAEFDPSPDHNAIGANGLPIVQRYDFLFFLAGSSQPTQTVSLGKPTPDATGKIRVSLVPLLTIVPTTGVNYQSRVDAVGPGGSTPSNMSNVFQFTAATTPCSYGTTPTTASIAAAGGTGTIGVTAGSGCGWTATSNSSWLTVAPGGGTGNGSVTYTAAANSIASGRTAIVTVGGQSVTISQAGLSCTYAVSPTSASLGSSGGTGTIGVTAGFGCGWTATSNRSWMTVTPASGTANGAVTYSVAANTTSTRTGTLTIGGRAVSVTQSATACSYALAPATVTISSSGGSGSISVTAPAGCSWSATSNSSWVTVASASGSGSGTVSFTVAVNMTASGRTATIAIGSAQFTVSQYAPLTLPGNLHILTGN
jgi:Viral BACON domain/Putative binding domain, N-terminal